IEKSPLDFADEAEASGRETAAPEMPTPEEVPVTTAPGSGQVVEAVVAGPPTVRESRKRGLLRVLLLLKAWGLKMLLHPSRFCLPGRLPCG
nr:hypothetical protein [Tanacetum cinerariifolium]